MNLYQLFGAGVVLFFIVLLITACEDDAPKNKPLSKFETLSEEAQRAFHDAIEPERKELRKAQAALKEAEEAERDAKRNTRKAKRELKAAWNFAYDEILSDSERKTYNEAPEIKNKWFISEKEQNEVDRKEKAVKMKLAKATEAEHRAVKAAEDAEYKASLKSFSMRINLILDDALKIYPREGHLRFIYTTLPKEERKVWLKARTALREATEALHEAERKMLKPARDALRKAAKEWCELKEALPDALQAERKALRNAQQKESEAARREIQFRRIKATHESELALREAMRKSTAKECEETTLKSIMEYKSES